MDSYYDSLAQLIEFILQNWWIILLSLTLLKFRRRSGITLCLFEILWTAIQIDYRIHVVFVIAIGLASIFEVDHNGNNIINIIPPSNTNDNVIDLNNNDDE